MGYWSLENLERGAYPGPIYPVNPGHEEILGRRCYPSLADLPETPDLVMFAVGDHRLERALDEAIAREIPAAVIMSSLCLDNDAPPLLKQRIKAKVDAAGMLVCGANGMGFYNVRDNTWCCGFDSRLHVPPGNASLISHSGSGMSGIIDCEKRLRLNVAVSTGNELSVTMDQYLDFVLDLPETRVVGLFLETARNPSGFREALEKATQKQIPIIVLKVGRTAKAAALTVSHSGAMAGDDATYEALFRHYGVHRVADMDELATAMILFAELNPVGPGGLVSLHDSGGERQLIVDLAEDAGVPLTELAPETCAALERVLDPELPAVNPLDAWSRGGEAAPGIMTDSLTIMMQDPGAAIAAVIHDRAPDGVIYESYVRYMKIARERSGKPVALVAARQGTGFDPLVIEETHSGFPVLDGVVPFLRGVRGLMDYRNFIALPANAAPRCDDALVAECARRLAAGVPLDEAGSLAMLKSFGLSVSECVVVSTEDELVAAAATMHGPLVLKTAMPGILHKTEMRGVMLNIADEVALLDAYRDLAGRLGPRALLTRMAPQGIEMILGARRDPQFGPVVMLGFGGVLAEVLRDVRFLLPPFDAPGARRSLDELKLRPLLDGIRGAAPAAIDRFCEMAAAFSAMVAALGDRVREIDINPVIVTEQSCIAVDALIVADDDGNE